MKKIGLIIITLYFLISCKNNISHSGYEINGILKNVSDSAVVTISSNNKIMDSTLVIGEKFRFTGKVDNPTNILLMIKSSTDYTFFWLENSKINFIAEKDKFIERQITGSEIQKEADILDQRIKPIRIAQDSLGNIMSERNLSKSYQDSIFVLYNKMREKESETTKNFIKEYPNSLVSSHNLNIYKSFWGKEFVNELFLLMNNETQNSNNGKSIARFIELNKNPQIGEKYVDFEQENMSGKKIKLSDIKGKYILIEFWASWCMPCRMSNPSLVAQYGLYNNKGFEIIGVSLDQDRDSWIKAIKKDNLIWENVSDLKGTENEPALIYGVNGIPDNLLIDENGIIIGRRLRGDILKKKLEEVFK